MSARNFEQRELDKARMFRPIYLAIGLTLLAELIFVLAWGPVLFPGGTMLGKLIWAVTCSIGIGAVAGLTTAYFVGGRTKTGAAIAIAALSLALVGIYCTFLCSWIDRRFVYFGGEQTATLFLLAGSIAAISGGVLYGWLLYGVESKWSDA